MRHFTNIKQILLAGIFLSSIGTALAQDNNKKKVLVVPPDRFQFKTAFNLTEIAAKNEMAPAEVFLNYEKALLSAFEQYEDENFEFIPIRSNEVRKYKRFIQYEAGKFKGKNYNAVNLSLLSEADFTHLLGHYQADFILFVTWYDIHKKNLMKAGMKRAKYAAHFMDYAVYNLFKQQVVGLAKVQAEAPAPNKAQIPYALLRLKEVKWAYTNFIDKVVEQLNQPIEIK